MTHVSTEKCNYFRALGIQTFWCEVIWAEIKLVMIWHSKGKCMEKVDQVCLQKVHARLLI